MRYLCIHGHFYQPPRENPWLEAIEVQDSAYPYHDWNGRIAAECYAPNAATRILDSAGRIERIVNNYSRISFNFGPTLLSWMRDKRPDLYEAIRAADKVSTSMHQGHGCAIAQAYNHMILPLANERDKRTQILWGIEDFRFHFRRDPEGMWLPETAVDSKSLDLLAECGIKFTILAPSQASHERAFGSEHWHDVAGGRIDPTRAYRFTAPSGRRLALFFYDGPISRAVAFEQLLNNGEVFANRLLSVLSQPRPWEELAHIATDGESYGHHHRHGEMALAWALNHIEQTGAAKITNYAQYLELAPPAHEARILEDTAWSCVHGVGRWTRDCGCNAGGHAMNQAWRGPLRDALDWLRDTIAPLYERRASTLVRDPWKARDSYIHVVLDRSMASRAKFLTQHATSELTDVQQVSLWKLLEMQRHAMLMYTSCGWFFDELSGIETVQVIQYAGRVVQLAEELFNVEVEAGFVERLSAAKSNLSEFGDGGRIYERIVKPSAIDLEEVGAHYAISSLFHPYPEEASIYCYRVERQQFRSAGAGRMRFAAGCARFTSEITQESGTLSFAVLHLGDHNIVAGVRRYDAKSDLALDEAWDAFARADAPNVLRLLDKAFGPRVYSVKSLFKDEQRAVLKQLLTATLEEAESSYRQVYEHNASLMRFLNDLGTPIPRAFRAAAEYALNSNLRRIFSEEALDIERAKALIDQAKSAQVDLDVATLEFALRTTLETLASKLQHSPNDKQTMERLTSYASFVRTLPFPVNLWHVQNIGYQLLKSSTNRNGIHALARELAIHVDDPAAKA